MARNVVTGRLILLKSARRLRYNVTLIERARAYYAALAAGTEPPDCRDARPTIDGDFDGAADLIDRAKQWFD